MSNCLVRLGESRFNAGSLRHLLFGSLIALAVPASAVATNADKPGTKEGDYPDWAEEAGRKALEDAGVTYDQVQQAYVGYCYGDSTAGQRAVYGLGLTGIPVVNVNNNCSTGSSALYLARQAVRGGLRDHSGSPEHGPVGEEL